MTAARHDARHMLAVVLDLSGDAVPDSARLGDPGAWDSLAHLRLILALEATLGRELEPEQIVGIECLDDIAAILRV
jgi:acyl carrier protein